jgi:Kdo2-lipid IVA lauroyltransferase/acyltransferase
MGKKKIKEDNKNNESTAAFLFNKVIAGILCLISLLPFSVLYSISDILCILLRDIFKYRKKVIYENLKFAFPEKSENEIELLMRKFYSYLADIMVETIKLHTISHEELDKRITFKGLERVEEYTNQNRSVIVLGMHHNNWEWTGFAQTKVSHPILLVYNPVRGNKSFENFLLYSRERWGVQTVPINKSARLIIDYHIKGIPAILFLAADQAAPAGSGFWTTFMYREAPFFRGPEKVAVKTNQPVFFQHVKKTGRGRYEAHIIELFGNPEKVEEKEIMLTYINTMESIIKQEPEYYLWSHRRWKHKRPENTPLMG